MFVDATALHPFAGNIPELPHRVAAKALQSSATIDIFPSLG
jgi:hypothetical protein